MLILASAPWCANCKPAKLALEAAGVEFEEFNVDGDDAEAQMPEGLRGIPSLILDGKIVATGAGGVLNYAADAKRIRESK